MPKSMLKDLPVELVEKICTNLDEPSILAFSLADKWCRSASATRLFETVCVNLYDAITLKAEVSRWSEILNQDTRRLLVRTLKLEDGSERQDEDHRIERMSAQYYIGDVYQDAGSLRLWSEDCVSVTEYARTNNSLQEDSAWYPLVELINELPGLERIIYSCTLRLPQCLLENLQRKRARVTLNISKFHHYLHHQHQTGRNTQLEMAPFLSKVALLLSSLGSDNADADNNYEDFDLMLQNARQLKEAQIWWSCPEDSSPLEEIMMPISREDTETLSLRVADLEIFHLRINGEFTMQRLEYWKQRINFAKLKALKVESYESRQPVFLKDTSYLFSSLQTLVLNLWTKGSGEASDLLMEKRSNHISNFLRNIRPLVNIRLITVLSGSMVDAISETHGCTLQQLWLENTEGYSNRVRFTIDQEQINLLCKKCAILKNLKIPLMRTGGNEAEVQIYKTLGSIASLRRLHINFYVSRPYRDRTSQQSEEDPSFDEVDRRIYYPGSDPPSYTAPRLLWGHVRDMFVNSAIDEAFARSIFITISANKPQNGSSLDLLILEPRAKSMLDDGYYWSTVVGDIINNIGRAYSLIRDVRDTHHNTIHVKEISRGRRIRDNAFHCGSDDPKSKSIFARLWPPSLEEDEEEPPFGWWRVGWHSFPLTTTSAEKADIQRYLVEHQPVFHSVSKVEVLDEISIYE